jgi:methionyl-tRNA formyltransferase
MKKLKIGYFADGPWSHRAFEKIIKNKNIEIAFIVPRTDSSDETLRDYSLKYNIPYHKGIKVNSRSFYKIAAEYNCDLFVSMSFNQIFKSRIINVPRLRTINCHAGKLPFYRGRNILNWVLINDEKEFGITVHYVDEGIDTGDIILQNTYPITDGDNYKTLLETAYENCAEILYQALLLFINDDVKPVNQKELHPIGFYCSKRSEGSEILDWNQTSREIFNFVRAICYPGPNARTFLNGKEMKINKVIEVKNAPKYKDKPGSILSKKPFYVKTSDSFVEIAEYDFGGKIRIGDRFETI